MQSMRLGVKLLKSTPNEAEIVDVWHMSVALLWAQYFCLLFGAGANPPLFLRFLRVRNRLVFSSFRSITYQSAPDGFINIKLLWC